MSAEWGAVLAVALMVAVNIGSVAFFLGGMRGDVRALDERTSKLEKKVFDL